MGEGVERLRGERGDEKVSFNDVADHLEDFMVREPGAEPTIERLASFLAGVEDAPHVHEGDTPTVDPAMPVA